MKEYLFTYHFGGSQWCISLFADDSQQAREKIKAAGMARYDGELVATIPAQGWIGRIVRWVTR